MVGGKAPLALEILTHTKRRDFKNCRRYFLHRHVNHLSMRKQKRGRRKGRIFGDGLEHARITQEEHGVDLAGDEGHRYSFFYQWLEQEYERLLDSANWSSEEYEEMEIERTIMGVMLTKYVGKYGIDQRREVEFYLPLRNPRTNRTSRAFRIGGKIDGVVVTADNHVAVVEDKLVSQIQRVMIERLELDDQTCEYVDAFMSKGWTADVWYRHTKWPGIKPKPPKQFVTKDDYPGETLHEFADRLMDDVDERPEFYFDQQILSFPRLHLDDYRRGRWGVAQQILQARKHAGTDREGEFFEKNPSRCWEYGGCEFIPLCCNWPDAQDLYVEVEENPELSEGGVTSEYAGN
jgi:hypothetical protein